MNISSHFSHIRNKLSFISLSRISTSFTLPLLLLALSSCAEDKSPPLPGERHELFAEDLSSTRPLTLRKPQSAAAQAFDFSRCKHCSLQGGYINDFSNINSIFLGDIQTFHGPQTGGQERAIRSTVKEYDFLNLDALEEIDLGYSTDFGRAVLPIIYGKSINGKEAVYIEQNVYGGNLQKISIASDYGYLDSLRNKKWQSDLFEPENRVDNNDTVGGIAVFDDGKAHVTVVTTGLADVLAFEDKILRWHISLPSTSRANPAIADGVVVVSAMDGKTYGISLKDGQVLWQHFGMSDKVALLAAPTLLCYKISGRTVVAVEHSNGEIIALDIKTGEEIWHNIIDAGIATSAFDAHLHNFVSHPVLKKGYIFATGANGILAKLDNSNGSIIWKQRYGISKSIWVTDDVTLAIAKDNILVAISNSTGQIAWRTDLSSANNGTVFSGPIVVNGKVLVVSSDGYLTGFDFTSGKELFKKEVIKGVKSTPIVNQYGLFLLSDDGTLAYY